MDKRNSQRSTTSDLVGAIVVVSVASIAITVLDLTNADISRLAVLTTIFTISLALLAKRRHLV